MYASLTRNWMEQNFNSEASSVHFQFLELVYKFKFWILHLIQALNAIMMAIYFKHRKDLRV